MFCDQICDYKLFLPLPWRTIEMTIEMKIIKIVDFDTSCKHMVHMDQCWAIITFFENYQFQFFIPLCETKSILDFKKKIVLEKTNSIFNILK